MRSLFTIRHTVSSNKWNICCLFSLFMDRFVCFGLTMCCLLYSLNALKNTSIKTVYIESLLVRFSLTNIWIAMNPILCCLSSISSVIRTFRLTIWNNILFIMRDYWVMINFVYLCVLFFVWSTNEFQHIHISWLLLMTFSIKCSTIKFKPFYEFQSFQMLHRAEDRAMLCWKLFISLATFN